ncbi:enhanced serine sensitivity protein SseB C-terminal domain-containing protein [Pseudomonas sp. W5-01]|uniref:enhanced serine sensitivity protein SseB C-terminal domain-containing protein n=1 Tax=Pseudomonas sp. W5-01 TaxID=3097454 RepID=UPI0039796807
MDTQQENTLEQSLRMAADEPAHRPDFFTTLLNSTVYVLGTAGTGKGHVTLEAGSDISIANWHKADGSPVIPFFSSLQTLQASIESEESYVEIPARSLFEITLGAPLFLNPKSPYGKEFLPEEVRHLLSDGIGQKPAQRTVEKNTNVLLGQPSQYPSRMVNSLTQLLAKHRNVKRAFLALMHDASVDQKPHLIIGIEADGDIERVMREAGSVAGDTAPDGEPVDLYRVTKGGKALATTSSRKPRLSMKGSRQGGCDHCLALLKRERDRTKTMSQSFYQM